MPEDFSAQNCKSCRFLYINEGRAMCVRNPPTGTLVPAQGLAGPTVQLVSFRPEVRPDDWCGEWRQSEKAAGSVLIS